MEVREISMEESHNRPTFQEVLRISCALQLISIRKRITDILLRKGNMGSPDNLSLLRELP